MRVEAQPVDARVVGVGRDRVLRLAQVRGAERVEEARVELHTDARQVAEQRRRDVDHHAVQTARRIERRQLLVLVVVVVAQLDLADALRGRVAEHLGEQADFETPVARDAHLARERGLHRELARERVAEAVHELDQRQLAAQRALQGEDQGRDEEPRHAAV